MAGIILEAPFTPASGIAARVPPGIGPLVMRSCNTRAKIGRVRAQALLASPVRPPQQRPRLRPGGVSRTYARVLCGPALSCPSPINGRQAPLKTAAFLAGALSPRKCPELKLSAAPFLRGLGGQTALPGGKLFRTPFGVNLRVADHPPGMVSPADCGFRASGFDRPWARVGSSQDAVNGLKTGCWWYTAAGGNAKGYSRVRIECDTV